jgi:hypothetical protein
MEDFYPIFKDMQNWRTPNYKDPFPNTPFPNKPKGEAAEETYRQLLLDVGTLHSTEMFISLIPVTERSHSSLPELWHWRSDQSQGSWLVSQPSCPQFPY